MAQFAQQCARIDVRFCAFGRAERAGMAVCVRVGCASGPDGWNNRRMPNLSPPMRRSDRTAAILDQLSEHGSVDVADLAERFKVSQATLRRDLQILEEQRLLRRTHGGAVAQDVLYELPVRYRHGQHREQKRAIAAEVVKRLPDGPIAVGLTGGSTTSEVARLLVERVDLTVVTNALNIAAELALRPRLKLVVTGGVSRSQSYELVGPWAEHTLRGVNIGVAVIGVDGISADGGLTTHDEVEAHTNATLIERAATTIVVADGSKVGRVLLARICGVDEVDELITDDSVDPVALRALRGAGLTVTVV
jgi:DeoR family transcriptional regulator, aga operon transcriptional repressor